MDGPRCETCRFWDCQLADAGGWGGCRRFPPVAPEFEKFDGGGVADVGKWPCTQDSDWCGEYRVKADAGSKALRSARRMVRFLELDSLAVPIRRELEVLTEFGDREYPPPGVG